VGTFALQGRVPDDFSEDSSATDERGYARLRMPAGERRLVVAAAKDHEPACRETTGGADDELKFVLRDGIAVSGRVVQDGRPVVGAEICVSPSSFNGRTIRIGETDVRWNEGGGVDTEDARATTGADGRWRVAGLADGTWRVRLDKLADGSSPMGYDVSIPPPHEPVEFDLSFGRLVVEVRCEGRPVAGVRLAVFIGGSVPSTKTDADGRAELQLAPSRPFAIETEHFGYRETRVEGTSPERGAVESLQIALTAKPPHGAIVVVVKDPDGRPIPRAGLAFFKGDATTPWDAEERFGNQAEGDFAFNDLEAGRYRLVVRPGRHWQPDWTWEGDAGTWLDETLDVEIPATGAKRYEVTARPGGRLRLSARGRDGLRLPAKCVVRDPAGHVVKHYVATRHGNRGAHSMGQDCLGQEAPTDVAEALPPGRYRVTLSVEGGAETSVDAEIVAGKTCELEGKLDAVAGPPPVLVRAEK
jgi:hypothetical protein